MQDYGNVRPIESFKKKGKETKDEKTGWSLQVFSCVEEQASAKGDDRYTNRQTKQYIGDHRAIKESINPKQMLGTFQFTPDTWCKQNHADQEGPI